MKRMLVIAALALAFGSARPAASKEPQVEPGAVAAAEKMLATMPADFYALEPAVAQQQIENTKPFLLDVREDAELKDGSIAGSVHIPLRTLAKAIAQLPENKATPVVTYCRVGHRGAMAMTILRLWGYTNVRTIKGGLEAWTKAGLPVEKKA